MASERHLHDQTSANPMWCSRVRWQARFVTVVATVAILALWTGAWPPTSPLSLANGEIEPSDVAVAMPELKDGKGSASRLVRSDSGKGTRHGIVSVRIVQLTAEKARLEAERDGDAEFRFPRGFATSDRTAAAAVARERRLFETRRAAVERQKAILGRRIAQVNHEVDALLTQQRAREKEVQLVREELQLIDDMHRRKLANIDRLMGLRRTLARSEGELGWLVAHVARARAQIEEIQLQVVEVEQKSVIEAHKEIRDIDARIDELRQRQFRDEDQPAGVEPRQDSRALEREKKRIERRSAGNS